MPYYPQGGGGRVVRGAGYDNLQANMMAAQSLAQMFQQIQQGQQQRGGQEFLQRLATAQNPQQRQQAIQTPTPGPQGFLGKLLQPINPFGTAGGVSPTQQGYLTQMMDEQNRESEYNRRANLQDLMQQRGEIRRQKLQESDPYYQERLKQARTPEPDPYAGLTPEEMDKARKIKVGLAPRASAGDKPLEDWQQSPDEKSYVKYTEEWEKEKNKEDSNPTKVAYLDKKRKATPYYQQNLKAKDEHQKYLGKMRIHNPWFWQAGGTKGELIQINIGSEDVPKWKNAEDSDVKMLLQESAEYLEPDDKAKLETIITTSSPEIQHEALRRIIESSK